MKTLTVITASIASLAWVLCQFADLAFEAAGK